MLRRRVARLSSLLATAVVERRIKLRTLPGGVEIGQDVSGVENVKFGGYNSVGRFTKFAEDVTVGYATTIGEHGYMVGPITIGSYCQFAPHTLVYGQNHPHHNLTPYVYSRMAVDGHAQASQVRKPIHIANGIWVGCNAVVLCDVEIGNGAVIGAGSVVTKSVPAYAIVVGNPARVIGYRFPDDIQELVERTRWWTRTVGQLDVLSDAMQVDAAQEPERFRELLNEAIAKLDDESW